MNNKKRAEGEQETKKQRSDWSECRHCHQLARSGTAPHNTERWREMGWWRGGAKLAAEAHKFWSVSGVQVVPVDTCTRRLFSQGHWSTGNKTPGVHQFRWVGGSPRPQLPNQPVKRSNIFDLYVWLRAEHWSNNPKSPRNISRQINAKVNNYPDFPNCVFTVTSEVNWLSCSYWSIEEAVFGSS